MKIEQSSLHMESRTLAWQFARQRSEAHLSITFPAISAPEPTRADISDQALALQQSEAVSERAPGESNDPRLQLLIAIIEALTGRKVELFDAHKLNDSTPQATPVETPAPAPAATETGDEPVWSLRIETSHMREELEVASFSARGEVSTAEGRRISFALDMTMQRYEREESSTTLEFGNAPRVKDPLVLNLATDRVRLLAEEFSFDLNVDGKTESLARLAAGSAFLVLDRNNNGRIDDGSELFGPTTGDGFEELAALDQDGNGWIDENDPAFARLQIWRPGEEAMSLLEANVGAIALDRVATDFTLKAEGETAGLVRTSGIFLSEREGLAKTIQQIDLVV